jgi:DNA mismatch repair protein MutS
MAHIGSFVPASSATIGLVDRVFSRIGMADRIVKGESTFLVEMIETSRILHYATRKSFIIMDEIGRGTSTYDGLSIAWAVLEYLLDEALVGAKVLFATHYHEITALQEREGVINYNATVKEWNNDVIFLRKIVPGSASRSYGVEVAKMAGIPDSIIERAKSILLGLQTKYGNYTSLLLKEWDQIEDGKFIEKANSVESFGYVEEKKRRDGMQLGLFPSLYEILANELKDIEINNITPLEALNILDRLKRSL